MLSSEIRQKFLNFFEKRGHAVIPSASLVPNKSDSSVLFTTAGMQPLVPYLMGNPHPAGKRLVNIQKCVRTQDIDEVGDNTHDTFFEMLGNWSLGDYFKEEAIQWSYELLTSKEEGFGLDINRLHVTVFEGDEYAPRDDESAKIWEKIGIPKEKIKYLGAADNWWPARKTDFNWTGPTGPCTEMFYDDVEIWNDVFMEYSAENGKITGKLSQKNVDTGAGLERLAMVLQGKDNIFDTDLFSSIMSAAGSRIVADHIRTACFMIADGVTPSNTDRGYILRRLLRRAYVRNKDLGPVIDAVINHTSYKGLYTFSPDTQEVIAQELEKFKKALDAGLKQIEKGEDPFILFTSFGLPLEIIEEVTKIDRAKFEKQMAEHKRLSSVSGEQKFKK
ncbi:MAG: Alanine-tRNA ligase [Parcubacteria group bacterium GW2011_GWA2_50_10b]|nr:MAG: Alanine-tRNA ligase [Parcubacteria group bacterium GW2011_GWA2_50_10b]